MKKTVKRAVSLLCMLCMLASVWLPLLPAAPAERASAVPASVSDEITVTDGSRYRVTVSYDTDAGIPAGAALSVRELTEGDEGYGDYLDRSAQALGESSEDIRFARALDITLYDPATGEEYQPTGSVRVSIALPDAALEESGSVSVVHFGEEPEVLPASVGGDSVEFETEGFSVYVLIAHEGDEEVVNPRVVFHFIDKDFTSLPGGVYTASPYNFLNKGMTLQTTQILTVGSVSGNEALEQVANPSNYRVTSYSLTEDATLQAGKTYYLCSDPSSAEKTYTPVDPADLDVNNIGNYYEEVSTEKFFYGWYVVELQSGGTDTTSFNPDTGRWEGSIPYVWDKEPDKIRMEQNIAITKEDGTALEGTVLKTGDTIRWTIGDVSRTGTLDETGAVHVYLAPIYEDFYFVNYRMGPWDDDNLAALRDSLLTRKLIVFGSDDLATVRISGVECPSPDPKHQVFVGWQEFGKTSEYYSTINVDTGAEVVYNLPITREEGVSEYDLYPVFAEARWLNYTTGLSGSGATYVPSKYLLTNNQGVGTFIQSMQTTRRNGYSFLGWYANGIQDASTGDVWNLTENKSTEVGQPGSTVTYTYYPAIQLTDGNGNFVPGVKGKVFYSKKSEADAHTIRTYMDTAVPEGEDYQKLYEITSEGKLFVYTDLEDLNLIAHWTPVDTTTYKVVVWRQKVTDDKDASYTTWGELADWLSEDDKRKAEDYPYLDKVKDYDFEACFVSDPVSTATTANLVTSFSGSYTYTDDNGNVRTGTVSNRNLADQGVVNGLAGLADDFTGCHYFYTDFVDGSLTPDGTTVYNVYYDRTKYTLRIYFARSYETTSGGSYVYTQVAQTNNNGTPTWQNGYSFDASAEYYRDINGNGTRTYYRNGKFYNSTNYNSTTNRQTIYIRTTTGGTTTKTFQTSASSTAHNDVTEFFHGSNNANPTTCGNGIRDVSDLCTYDNIGTMQDTRNGVTYTYYYYPIEALYGQDISELWPKYEYFKGNGSSSNNNKATSIVMMLGAQGITNGATSGGDVTVKGKITIMDDQILGNLNDPDGNFMWHRYGSGNNWRYYIWKEQMPGEDYSTYAYSFTDHNGGTTNLTHAQSVQTKGGRNYYVAEVVLVRSGSQSQHAPSYEGFEPQSSLEEQDNDTFRMDYFYTRNEYSLTFNVNYPEGASITYNGVAVDNGAVRSSDRTEVVPYAKLLSGYGYTKNEDLTTWYWGVDDETNDSTVTPALIGPDHYTFEGWYVDATCTKKFDFVGTSAKPATMPAANKVLYAKWEPLWFVVSIDPNGAEIDRIDHTQSGSFSRAEIPGERPADTGFNSSQSTYFWLSYGGAIGEYAVSRSYVPISDAAAEQYTGQIYYYMNHQYEADLDGDWGLNAYARNALFLTEAELTDYYNFYAAYATSAGVTVLDFGIWKAQYLEKQPGSTGTDVKYQKYRKAGSNEHYEFLGWFQVLNPGTENERLSALPYVFSTPVEGPVTLRAMWRLDGGYKIQYHADYSVDGALINGTMQAWLDPWVGKSILSYTDGAATSVYKQPYDIRLNGEPTSDYIFRGFRKVFVSYDVNNEPIYTPVMPIVYYDPADPFEVLAADADAQGYIHLQAVYESKNSAYRRPEITNLTLDANNGFLTTGSTASSTASELLADRPITSEAGWDRVGTVFMNAAAETIAFGDIQSSADVHLYRFATELTHVGGDSGKAELNPPGTNYFEHPNRYFLLGFDEDPAEGDFVATYPADGTIAVTRKDRKTVYAVWEPLVYLNFVNNTDKAITFSLGSNEGALTVLNAKHGLYHRVPLTAADMNAITIEAGEKLMFAVPTGEERNVTVTVKNELGIGKVLTWDSSLTVGETTYTTVGKDGPYTYTHDTTCEHVLAKGRVNNNQTATFNEKLIFNPNGITVTFDDSDYDYALVLEANWNGDGTGGGYQEYDYSTTEVEGHTSQTLYSTSTRPGGYQFLGWAYEYDATEPDFSATKPDGNPWTIADLYDFYNSASVHKESVVTTDPVTYSEHTLVIARLYAVWTINKEASTVFVYKDVPLPGNQSAPFKFELKLQGTYTYTPPNRSPITSDLARTEEFYLYHGDHAVLVSSNSTTEGWIETKVTVYKENGADPPTEQTYRVQAPSGSYGAGGSFNGTEQITVKEIPATYYTTTVSRTAQTDDYALYVGESKDTTTMPFEQTTNEVYWKSTFAGGTVVFTNTREKHDVTVNKTLVSNTSSVGTFPFTYSYILDGDNAHPVTGSFYVTSGTPNTTSLKDMPAGAVLTITETNDGSYETVMSAQHASDEDTSDDYGFTFTVTQPDTVTFANTLKSYPVKFIKVDQDMATNVNAMFSLTGPTGSLGNSLYASSTANGVFYTSSKFWVGEYTLKETITPSGYEGLGSAGVKIRVTGDDADPITCTDDHVKIEKDSGTGVYNIYVINQNMVTMTVKKVLHDPILLGGTKAFNFKVEYSYTLNGKTIDKTGSNADVVTVESSNAVTGSGTFRVPVGASLTVTETFNAADTNAYDTTYAVANGSTEIVPDTSGTACVFASPVAAGDQGNVLTFTNNKKTVDVTVKKELEDAADTNVFRFSAKLTLGITPIVGAVVNDMGTAATTDDLVTDSDGQVFFVLDCSDATTDVAAEQILKVPAGVRLLITETAAGPDTGSVTPEKLSEYSVEITGPAAGTKNEENKSFTLTVPGTGATVTFKNGTGGADVIFKKIDGFGNALVGAKFTLYKEDNSTVVDSQSSDDAGDVHFEKVPNGVFYLRETEPFPTDSHGITWKNSKTYVLLVGTTYLVPETGVLIGISQAQLDAQLDSSGTYAIFRYDTSSNKAAADPDIRTFGILNETEATRRVILRKADNSNTSLAMLPGAHFRVFRPDLSEVKPKDGSKDFQSLSSGVWFSDELPYGKYYLVETKAPEGYSGSAGNVYVLVVTETMTFDGNGIPVKRLEAKTDQVNVSVEDKIVEQFREWRLGNPKE